MDCTDVYDCLPSEPSDLERLRNVGGARAVLEGDLIGRRKGLKGDQIEVGKLSP